MSDGKGEYNLIINVPDATTNDVRSGTPSIVAPKRITLPPAARASVPILSYCFASILMTVTNKYVVSGRDFNMNFMLLAIQTVTTVVFLWLFKFLNLIKYRDFDWDESRKWFPITVFLVAMIYTGSKALQYLRIPIYTIFKNLTIILIAYGEVLWFGGAVTRLMLVSFFLIVLSSVIAGWSDISEAMNNFTEPNATQTTFLGYFWMANNCFWSGAYVLYMRKRIKLTNFKDFDTMFYNNLLSIPLLLVLSLGFEDWGQENLLKNFPPESREALFYAMIFSGVSAFGISYTSAWCVRVTSSTTYSMVGALNKLPIAASGMIFFGDPVTYGGVTAIFVGFVSGLVYSYAKTNQPKQISTSKGMIPMSSSSQSAADGIKANDKP